MADDRELDELLDRALASYADQEPDASLRTRILARTEEASPRPKRLWLFAPAAACAAAILLALLLHPPVRSPRPQPTAEPSGQPSIASAPNSAAAAPRQMVGPRVVLTAQPTRRSARPARARSARFPAPSPLTAEEKILLQFAAEHPEQARRVLSGPVVKPLETSPLTITPIQITALADLDKSETTQKPSRD